MPNVYCPKCNSKEPMVKAGIMYTKYGKSQRYLCVNKRCRRISIHPLKDK